jgi:hypothetical protein
MTREGSGLSRFAKGIFIGGILATVATMLFALKTGMDIGSGITEVKVAARKSDETISESRMERRGGTTRRINSGGVWRVVFYIASGIALIADAKYKKTE